MGRKAADILQKKEQSHVEFNNSNADRTFCSNLPIIDLEIWNICWPWWTIIWKIFVVPHCHFLLVIDCNLIIVSFRHVYVLGKATFRKLWCTSSVFLPHVCFWQVTIDICHCSVWSREVTVFFWRGVCLLSPNVWMHYCSTHQTDFPKILYLEPFWKLVEKLIISLKSGKNITLH